LDLGTTYELARGAAAGGTAEIGAVSDGLLAKGLLGRVEFVIDPAMADLRESVSPEGALATESFAAGAFGESVAAMGAGAAIVGAGKSSAVGATGTLVSAGCSRGLESVALKSVP